MGLYISIGILILAGITLILWFHFHKRPITKAAIADTSDKKLVKEEKTNTLLPRVEDKVSVISKKDKYRIKGYRDNAISRKYDELFPLSKRPFARFGTFQAIESKWYWPRKGEQ